MAASHILRTNRHHHPRRVRPPRRHAYPRLRRHRPPPRQQPDHRLCVGRTAGDKEIIVMHVHKATIGQPHARHDGAVPKGQDCLGPHGSNVWSCPRVLGWNCVADEPHHAAVAGVMPPIPGRNRLSWAASECGRSTLKLAGLNARTVSPADVVAKRCTW